MVKYFGENVSSLEDKGKKLGKKKKKKRRLKTEFNWNSSRIHLQTKKVGGMVGREESGVKDGLFLKGHLYCEVEHLEEIEK